MNPSPKRVALLALVALPAFAACSADRTHFYTLLQPEPATATVAGGAAFAIDVQHVRVPAQVDQPQLVVRQGAGELALVETRQWIAPLKDEMRGALSAALTQRLHAHDVAGVAAPAGMPVYQVTVDVQRFDGWLAHSVGIDAVWTVRAGGDVDAQRVRTSWTCASHAGVAVGSGYEPLVVGAQQAVAQIAAQIATLIEAAQRDAGTAGCPAAG